MKKKKRKKTSSSPAPNFSTEGFLLGYVPVGGLPEMHREGNLNLKMKREAPNQ